MPFPFLVSKILRGQWAIDPRQAIDLGGFVAGVLSGSLEFDEKPELEIMIAGADMPPILLSSLTHPDAADSGKKQQSMFDAAPEGSVAIIPLKGSMMKEDTGCSYGTASISRIMLEASAHKNISGTILEIDSGGGAIDAIPPLLSAIKESSKPIVAWADLMASAALWVGVHTAHVMAANDISAEFGSVGVMVSFADMRPVWEKGGVVFHKIYAPESTHKNQDFEMALKGDYKLMKEQVLSPLARTFMNDIRKARKGKIDISVEGILTGRMFYAKDALRHGFIDSIGNIDAAVAKVYELSNQQK